MSSKEASIKHCGISISTLAEIALAGTYPALDARLKKIEFDWVTDGVKAEGSFHYLSFRDGHPTQDDFLELVYHKIIPFCLDRQYIRSCLEKLLSTRDEQYFHKPVDAAKALFIKAKKKNAKSGEPGEVILFTLLEGFLNAPRIVSKMQLKTNPNMEVHGSDAIHLKFDANTETLIIYWGEAKLYKDLPKALDKIADSIKSFREYNPEIGDTQRAFDISIIQSHPDIDADDNQSTKEALLSFFDPYSTYSNNVKEIHACLAIWDWELYKELTKVDPDEVENFFCEKYAKRIESACSLFIDKIKNKGLTSFRFHLFLIPLSDVKEFRRRFCQKVGLPFEEDVEDYTQRPN